MEFQDYIGLVKRYLKVILATTLIGGVAGVALTFLIPRQAPVYTSTTQGVLLTGQAAETLQNSIERAKEFTATTTVLVLIPSPDESVSDEEYTKSRLSFYSKILASESTLNLIAEKTGVSIDGLRNRVALSTSEDSTLVSIRVSNAKSELAARLSESVADELVQRINSIETRQVGVEILGTQVTAPVNLPLTMAARDLILSDPLAVSQLPTEAIVLFGENEYELVSPGLPLPRTSDQIKAALSLTSGLPSTSAQVEPATAEQLGTITITATDPDPDTADRIVSNATALLQEKISRESGLSESANSPLVVTGETSAAESSIPGANPSRNSRLGVNIILGLLIGAAIGLGYAFLRVSQDTTIRNARRLVELTGDLPIGIISKVDAPVSNSWTVMLSETSLAAENYRALRANLMFGLPDAKVFCLTPAGSGGTATTGLNLAVALSQAGQSVILVEANLHEPELSQALNLGGPKGLGDVLAGTSTAQNAIELWAPGGISVLSAKHVAPNSSEMLSTETFTRLIDELRSLYSYVIISTPSALNSTDAVIVASRCDATLLLAECDKSTTDQLEIAVTSLLQVGAPIAGVVISEVPASEVNSWRAAHVSNPPAAS